MPFHALQTPGSCCELQRHVSEWRAHGKVFRLLEPPDDGIQRPQHLGVGRGLSTAEERSDQVFRQDGQGDGGLRRCGQGHGYDAQDRVGGAGLEELHTEHVADRFAVDCRFEVLSESVVRDEGGRWRAEAGWMGLVTGGMGGNGIAKRAENRETGVAVDGEGGEGEGVSGRG